MTAPNGVALSPDDKTLYVAQSGGEKPVIMAFALNDDGTADAGRVLFDATGGVNGEEGRLRRHEGRRRRDALRHGPGRRAGHHADGKHLGTIAPGPQPTANCAFGDADGMTLYMTSDMYLCRVRLKVKGDRF
jgi:gluconolactonase